MTKRSQPDEIVSYDGEFMQVMATTGIEFSIQLKGTNRRIAGQYNGSGYLLGVLDAQGTPLHVSVNTHMSWLQHVIQWYLTL